MPLTQKVDTFKPAVSNKPFVFKELGVAPALRSFLVSADKPAGEAQMNKAIRIALGSAALATGLAFAAAPPANAQVRFEGSFPLPHGRITVGGGGFGVGSYVPDGYSVYDDPDNGYGFYDGDQWYSCEQDAGRWIIIAPPVFYGRRSYGSVRPYRNYGYRYSQPYRYDGRRYDNRSFANRGYTNRSFDNQRFDNRSYTNRSFDNRRSDNRSFGNRSNDNSGSRNRGRDSGRSGRGDRQSQDRGRNWNR